MRSVFVALLSLLFFISASQIEELENAPRDPICLCQRLDDSYISLTYNSYVPIGNKETFYYFIPDLEHSSYKDLSSCQTSINKKQCYLRKINRSSDVLFEQINSEESCIPKDKYWDGKQVVSIVSKACSSDNPEDYSEVSYVSTERSSQDRISKYVRCIDTKKNYKKIDKKQFELEQIESEIAKRKQKIADLRVKMESLKSYDSFSGNLKKRKVEYLSSQEKKAILVNSLRSEKRIKMYKEKIKRTKLAIANVDKKIAKYFLEIKEYENDKYFMERKKEIEKAQKEFDSSKEVNRLFIKDIRDKGIRDLVLDSKKYLKDRASLIESASSEYVNFIEQKKDITDYLVENKEGLWLGRCFVLKNQSSGNCDYYLRVDGRSYSYYLPDEVAFRKSPHNTGCLNPSWDSHIKELNSLDDSIKDNPEKWIRAHLEYLLDNGICGSIYSKKGPQKGISLNWKDGEFGLEDFAKLTQMLVDITKVSVDCQECIDAPRSHLKEFDKIESTYKRALLAIEDMIRIAKSPRKRMSVEMKKILATIANKNGRSFDEISVEYEKNISLKEKLESLVSLYEKKISEIIEFHKNAAKAEINKIYRKQQMEIEAEYQEKLNDLLLKQQELDKDFKKLLEKELLLGKEIEEYSVVREKLIGEISDQENKYQSCLDFEKTEKVIAK